jgi:hypothetical protein
MFNFESDSRFTNHLHYMITDRLRVVVWDLLVWLDSKYEVDSLYDLLRYIRLVADYGDANQGQLFFEMIKGSKQLGNVSLEIAERYIKRGSDTGVPWLKDLGEHIREMQKQQKAATPKKA